MIVIVQFMKNRLEEFSGVELEWAGSIFEAMYPEDGGSKTY